MISGSMHNPVLRKEGEDQMEIKKFKPLNKNEKAFSLILGKEEILEIVGIQKNRIDFILKKYNH